MPGQVAPPVPPPPTSTHPAPAATQKKVIWKRWWFWVVVVLVVAIVAAASGEPPSNAPAPPQAESDSATVPRVRGATVEQATRALERLGIDVEVSVRRQFSAKPARTVLAQTPAAGSMLSDGSIVALTIARPFPRVPNVVGLSVTAARNALREEGFGVAVRRVVSDSAKDTVLSQSPAVGIRVSPSRSITLTVAKPAPQPSAPPSGTCTSGYSPCLPPASDYDCAGGSGDGPEYVYGTVTVTGSDPYGLDADNDGSGCE